jgi:hypothetical protein
MARGSSKNFDSTLAAELGSVPLPVVAARIERFIVEDGESRFQDMEYAGGCSRRR